MKGNAAPRILLTLSLVGMLCTPVFLPATVAPLQPPSLSEMVVATVAEPVSVDPHLAYDTISGELIFNVCETLIFYDAESIEQFVPQLATDWWISQDGLTYVFKMRGGVKFHNGETLTPKDVEYTFERLMVRDFANSPSWMIYEALFNIMSADPFDPNFDSKIDNAVQSNTTHVWFNLARPFTPLLTILSQPWSSILNKKFMIEHGDWPQTWDNWTLYHDPEFSPLDNPTPVMCGTGPFKFDYWIIQEGWSIVKFDDYWGGWPAKRPKINGILPQGYLERATVKVVYPWTKTLEGFLSGTYDIIPVSASHIPEVEGKPRIRCFKNLPTLSIAGALFFTFNISLRGYLDLPNPFIGTPPHDPGALHETGIPVDFFSDIHVRKAFAQSFNYTAYIQDPYGFSGEALQPATPVLQGLPYNNPSQEKYELNLTEAEEHFKQAYDGRLWQEGFNLTIVMQARSLPPPGNWPYVLKANIESLNPKFHINIISKPWSYFMGSVKASTAPLFMWGWIADYPDPHPLVEPFMYSEGDIARWQRYSNATVDELVNAGEGELSSARRLEIYYRLQSLYHEDIPSVMVAQRLARHWEREWVRGWYYNMAYPGIYFYPLWKSETPPKPPLLTANISVAPETLNLRSKGRWITTYIELPEGYDVSDIDASSIRLNGTLSVDSSAKTRIEDHDNDTQMELMVRFNRSEVSFFIFDSIDMTELLKSRFKIITLTVTGRLNDGTPFQGTATLRINCGSIARLAAKVLRQSYLKGF